MFHFRYGSSGRVRYDKQLYRNVSPCSGKAHLMIEILNVRALKRDKRNDDLELLDRIEGTRIVYETDQEKEIKRQKQERKK